MLSAVELKLHDHAKSMKEYRRVPSTAEILDKPKLKYTWECFACDLTFQPYEGYFTCHLCAHKFHKKCTISYSGIPYDILAGDEFYQYTCIQCSKSTEDSLFRLKMTWTDVCHVILYHQTLCYQSSLRSTAEALDENGNPTKLVFKYFHWKVLVDQMRLHWDKFWTRNFNKPWIPQFTEPLTMYSTKVENPGNLKSNDPMKQARFVRSKVELEKPGYYGLLDPKKNPVDYLPSKTSPTVSTQEGVSSVNLGYKVLPTGKLQKISANSNAVKSSNIPGIAEVQSQDQNSQKSSISIEKDSMIIDTPSDQVYDSVTTGTTVKPNKQSSSEISDNKLLSPISAGSSSFKLIRGAKYTTNKIYWPFDFDTPNPVAGAIPTTNTNLMTSSIRMAKGGNDNLIHPRVVHMPSDWKPLSGGSSSVTSKGETPPVAVRNLLNANSSAPTNLTTLNNNLLLFPDGFRTAKATHGVSHGSWYFEVTVIGAAVSNVSNDSIQVNRNLDQVSTGKSNTNPSSSFSKDKFYQCDNESNGSLNSTGSNVSKCTCKDENSSINNSSKADTYICTCKDDEVKSNPIYAARVGVATILGDTHAPCGYDEYGYSLCSITGKWYHCRGLRNLTSDSGSSADHSNSVASNVFDESPSDPRNQIPCTYQIGDTIGVHLSLPPLPESVVLEEEAENQLLGLQMAREKEYPPLRSLNLADENGVGWHIIQRLHPGSRLTFYKNGKYIGHIPSLYRGKYYPAISGFHSVLRINFGWVALPGSNFPPSSPDIFNNLQGFHFPPANLLPPFSTSAIGSKRQNPNLQDNSDSSTSSPNIPSFLSTTLSVASLPFVPEAPWLIDDFNGSLTFAEARWAKKQKQEFLSTSKDSEVTSDNRSESSGISSLPIDIASPSIFPSI